MIRELRVELPDLGGRGVLERDVQDVIEEPEVGGLDRDRLSLPVLREADPREKRHLDLMLGAVNHDVVSHDHLVAFVEEADPILARIEHVSQSE
jgi:hypothetical protein